jgi:hypothetical protein
MYKAEAEATMSWGNYEAERIKDVYDYFTRHFSFSRKCVPSLRDLVKNRDQHLNVLLKSDAKLNAKKEKLFT